MDIDIDGSMVVRETSMVAVLIERVGSYTPHTPSLPPYTASQKDDLPFRLVKRIVVRIRFILFNAYSAYLH